MENTNEAKNLLEGNNLLEGYKFDDDDHSRISDLFNELDVNGDGHIDIKELYDGLHRLKQHSCSPGEEHSCTQAEQIMKIGDITDDNKLSFDEFLKYCNEHEQKLWLVFKAIDKNNSGTVTADEIKSTFEKIGVPLSESEANTLLQNMDSDGSLQVDWSEWREHHQLTNMDPENMKESMKEWKHNNVHRLIGDMDNMNLPVDLTEEEKKTGMYWKQFFAGGVAGVVSRTATAPLDRLKILLQVHAGRGKNNWSLQRGLHKMLSEGGFLSLWRGNSINCLKIFPESGIKFFAYENIKKCISSNVANKTIGPRERFFAGALAGIISQTTIYPMEVMKTRLALGKTGEYRGMFDCGKQVYQNAGIRGFYRGLVPGLIGVMPYAGTDLCVYETLKMQFPTNESGPGVLVLLFCGVVSSTCGQLVSYPLALIRTKLQAQTSDPSFTGMRANGMTDMCKEIVRQNGLFGLYRGIVPNFLKVAPAVSISYVVYEKVRKLLGMT